MQNKNYLYNNYLNMARNLRTENNLLKALSFYKKAYNLEIGKKDIELLIDMALIYDEIGLKSEAEEKYFEVIELDKDEARAYYGLAIIYDDNDELGTAKKYYEKLLAELMWKIDCQKGFPKRLSLEEQGMFAIGYYHQKQKKYEKREEK